MNGGRGLSARMLVGAALALFLALLVSACERPPSADGLKEWAPGDHDRAEELTNVKNGQQAAPVKGDAGGQTLVDITWDQACATCHGRGGHGDGPSGPMVNAPDLTSADLQAKYSDDEIATLIGTGKNRMPKFDLPASVVKGLVAKVRSLRGR